MNVLGIDIGTTSVKIVVKDIINNNIVKSIIKDTNSTIPTQNKFHHEQNVEKIVETITNNLKEIDPIFLNNVGHIGICGQQHGVMFWNDNKVSCGLYEHSNLITWMDQRCNDDNFIDLLPKMPSYIVKELIVSSGYGCATIFHMNRFEKDFLDQWKYAGNIVDFIACQICNISRPVMSNQMAHSWGYYDILNNCWFRNLLEENDFPMRFLPDTNYPGSVLGLSSNNFHELPEKAIVYIGMGDLQCSMYFALRDNLNAAINMSTSSQFVIRDSLQHLKIGMNKDQGDVINLPPGLVINPFFNDDILLVAASLNGGNVLAHFVVTLQQWISEISGTEISKEKIWSCLLSTYGINVSETGDQVLHDSLTINPLLFGERHCPKAGANISNIFPFNCSLRDVYGSICKGLVTNLTNLLPLEIIKGLKVKMLTCSGGVIKRHKCVADMIKNTYSSSIYNIHFMNDYDACIGVVDYLSDII